MGAVVDGEVERLASSAYVSLTTFRRDGTPVATPVWVSSDGERLYVWTDAGAGKVKRVRAGGRVLLAPCDARGRLQGAQVEGTAVVLDSPDDLAMVGRLHQAKYGLQFRLFRLAAPVFRRDLVGIAVTLG